MKYAESVRAFTCDDPQCKCVHLRLYDCEGNEIAEATLTPKMIKHLHDTLYAVIMEKGD